MNKIISDFSLKKDNITNINKNQNPNPENGFVASEFQQFHQITRENRLNQNRDFTRVEKNRAPDTNLIATYYNGLTHSNERIQFICLRNFVKIIKETNQVQLYAIQYMIEQLMTFELLEKIAFLLDSPDYRIVKYGVECFSIALQGNRSRFSKSFIDSGLLALLLSLLRIPKDFNRTYEKVIGNVLQCLGYLSVEREIKRLLNHPFFIDQLFSIFPFVCKNSKKSPKILENFVAIFHSLVIGASLKTHKKFISFFFKILSFENLPPRVSGMSLEAIRFMNSPEIKPLYQWDILTDLLKKNLACKSDVLRIFKNEAKINPPFIYQILYPICIKLFKDIDDSDFRLDIIHLVSLICKTGSKFQSVLNFRILMKPLLKELNICEEWGFKLISHLIYSNKEEIISELIKTTCSNLKCDVKMEFLPPCLTDDELSVLEESDDEKKFKQQLSIWEEYNQRYEILYNYSLFLDSLILPKYERMSEGFIDTEDQPSLFQHAVKHLRKHIKLFGDIILRVSEYEINNIEKIPEPEFDWPQEEFQINYGIDNSNYNYINNHDNEDEAEQEVEVINISDLKKQKLESLDDNETNINNNNFKEPVLYELKQIQIQDNTNQDNNSISRLGNQNATIDYQNFCEYNNNNNISLLKKSQKIEMIEKPNSFMTKISSIMNNNNNNYLILRRVKKEENQTGLFSDLDSTSDSLEWEIEEEENEEYGPRAWNERNIGDFLAFYVEKKIKYKDDEMENFYFNHNSNKSSTADFLKDFFDWLAKNS